MRPECSLTFRVDKLAEMRVEAFMRTFFVRTHQSRMSPSHQRQESQGGGLLTK